ncbi:MAG: hypothetical protein ACTSRZ_07455 [Promethearchaeota archaeon]
MPRTSVELDDEEIFNILTIRKKLKLNIGIEEIMSLKIERNVLEVPNSKVMIVFVPFNKKKRITEPNNIKKIQISYIYRGCRIFGMDLEHCQTEHVIYRGNEKKFFIFRLLFDRKNHKQIRYDNKRKGGKKFYFYDSNLIRDQIRDFRQILNEFCKEINIKIESNIFDMGKIDFFMNNNIRLRDDHYASY